MSSRSFRLLFRCSSARLLVGIAILGLSAVRCAADDDQPASDVQPSSGPGLSDEITNQFEEVTPLVDAKQWTPALAKLDAMAASVNPSTFQGGYDLAVILDTKAKILAENDQMLEAADPWEKVLSLCAAHPTYFTKEQTTQILHYLAEIYSQEATTIKLNPGPDLAQRQQIQLQYFDKAVDYIKRWLKVDPKVTEDDQLFYADMLFNEAGSMTGDANTKLLNEAEQEAEKGLLMSVHPRFEFYTLVAGASEQTGNLVKAAKYFEYLAALKPDSKVYSPQLMAIYTNLAEDPKDKVNSRKYYLRTINTIERAQAHGLMNDQKTNLNLVTIYFTLNQFGKATELLSAGLRNGAINPVETNWEVLAYCYQQLNENQKVIDTYVDAEKLYPDNGQLDYWIGRVYYQLDDMTNAYKCFITAEQKGHVQSPYQLEVILAYTAFEIDKFDAALQACDTAAKMPDARKNAELAQLRAAIEDRIKENAKAKPAGPATPL